MVWCPVLVRVMNGWMRAVWECVENIILERLRKNGSKEHHTGKEMRPVQCVVCSLPSLSLPSLLSSLFYIFPFQASPSACLPSNKLPYAPTLLASFNLPALLFIPSYLVLASYILTLLPSYRLHSPTFHNSVSPSLLPLCHLRTPILLPLHFLQLPPIPFFFMPCS